MRKERIRGASLAPIRDDSSESRESSKEAQGEVAGHIRVAQKADKKDRESCNCVTCLLASRVANGGRETARVLYVARARGSSSGAMPVY